MPEIDVTIMTLARIEAGLEDLQWEDWWVGGAWGDYGEPVIPLRCVYEAIGDEPRSTETGSDFAATYREVRSGLEDAELDLDRALAALRELVRLKDGPRDAAYELDKPAAWESARAVLADVEPQP